MDAASRYHDISAGWGSLPHRKVRYAMVRVAFSVMSPWPGSSPDLSPIEHAWTKLKMEVSKRNPSSYDNLKEIIKDVWVKEMTVEYFEKLIHSMPDRIQAVLAVHGRNTKY